MEFRSVTLSVTLNQNSDRTISYLKWWVMHAAKVLVPILFMFYRRASYSLYQFLRSQNLDITICKKRQRRRLSFHCRAPLDPLEV